jgi:hypothetical protein
MIVSTAILVVGLFCVVHGEKICPWLFERDPPSRCPTCVGVQPMVLTPQVSY